MIRKNTYKEPLCAFNPRTDVEQVVPELSVDLSLAMVSGKVQNVVDTSQYTNEDDVHSVGTYVRDKLQALQAAMDTKASLAAARERAKAKKAAAAAPAASPTGAEGA